MHYKIVMRSDKDCHKILAVEVSVSDSFVTCCHEDQWYIGKCSDMDDEDVRHVQVTFLKRTKVLFK